MIVIPEVAWQQMLKEFSRIRRRVERVAYFDGVRYPGGGTITTLTIPNAVLRSRNYEVSADAMSQAGKHLRANRLVRLAQVHTHPGDWVGHSDWDDLMAYSQMPGALSIVLPYHARSRPTLAEAGVHVREADGWRRLGPGEVPEWVRTVPSFLDFRR